MEDGVDEGAAAVGIVFEGLLDGVMVVLTRTTVEEVTAASDGLEPVSEVVGDGETEDNAVNTAAVLACCSLAGLVLVPLGEAGDEYEA